MNETTRMITVESATKAMSKKEGVGMQWEIKAIIQGVSGSYATGFFASLQQVPEDPKLQPYRGQELRCMFRRGRLNPKKTGQYQDHYYWDLMDWDTADEVTPLPPIESQQQQSSAPPQGPQTEREAGEQMEREAMTQSTHGGPAIEPIPKGRVTAVYLDHGDIRWGAVLNAARDILIAQEASAVAKDVTSSGLENITDEAIVYRLRELANVLYPLQVEGPTQPAPDATQAVSSLVVEPIGIHTQSEAMRIEPSSGGEDDDPFKMQEDPRYREYEAEQQKGIDFDKLRRKKELEKELGSETPSTEVEVLYDAGTGERIFSSRGKFMQAAGKPQPEGLGLDMKAIFALLTITNIDAVNWQDFRTWKFLEASIVESGS